MKKHLLLLIISSVVLCTAGITSACRKEKPVTATTIVEGRLMAAGTERAVEGGPYKMALRYGPFYESLDETYTDENGYYKLTYTETNPDPFQEYRVYFLGEVPEGYNNWIGTDPAEGIRPGFQGIVNTYIARKAWLRLHVENTNPHPLDRIRIEFRVFGDVFYGNQNFEMVFLGSGNIHNYLRYWVSKEGAPSEYYSDSVLLGDMDTTYYKIEY